ncbi:mitochondrial ribosomal protein L2, putative [Schistosoma mansoni]|nr:mitochondrial ribosomal protein L2, putative [Schistosoma mansoni]|eukprot:XP_018645585.1 mitochondrial ribosomal protein L2, putative [Schistosoma mansoni]
MNLCSHLTNSLRLYTNFSLGNKLLQSSKFSPSYLTR